MTKKKKSRVRKMEQQKISDARPDESGEGYRSYVTDENMAGVLLNEFSAQEECSVDATAENLIASCVASVIEAWTFHQAAVLDHCYKAIDTQLARWLDELLDSTSTSCEIAKGDTLFTHIGRKQNELIQKAKQKKSDSQAIFQKNMRKLRSGNLFTLVPLDPETTTEAVIDFIKEQMDDDDFDIDVRLAGLITGSANFAFREGGEKTTPIPEVVAKSNPDISGRGHFPTENVNKERKDSSNEMARVTAAETEEVVISAHSTNGEDDAASEVSIDGKSLTKVHVNQKIQQKRRIKHNLYMTYSDNKASSLHRNDTAECSPVTMRSNSAEIFSEADESPALKPQQAVLSPANLEDCCELDDVPYDSIDMGVTGNITGDSTAEKEEVVVSAHSTNVDAASEASTVALEVSIDGEIFDERASKPVHDIQCMDNKTSSLHRNETAECSPVTIRSNSAEIFSEADESPALKPQQAVLLPANSEDCCESLSNVRYDSVDMGVTGSITGDSTAEAEEVVVSVHSTNGDAAAEANTIAFEGSIDEEIFDKSSSKPTDTAETQNHIQTLSVRDIACMDNTTSNLHRGESTVELSTVTVSSNSTDISEAHKSPALTKPQQTALLATNSEDCCGLGNVPCDSVDIIVTGNITGDSTSSLLDGEYTSTSTVITTKKDPLTLPYEHRRFSSNPASILHNTTLSAQPQSEYYNIADEAISYSVECRGVPEEQATTFYQSHHQQSTYQPPPSYYYTPSHAPALAHTNCGPWCFHGSMETPLNSLPVSYGYQQPRNPAVETSNLTKWNAPHRDVMPLHLPNTSASASALYRIPNQNPTVMMPQTQISLFSTSTPLLFSPPTPRTDDLLAFPEPAEMDSSRSGSSTSAVEDLPICRAKAREIYVQLASANTLPSIEVGESHSQQCVQTPLEIAVVAPAITTSLLVLSVKPKPLGRAHSEHKNAKKKEEKHPVKFITAREFGNEEMELGVHFGWIEQPELDVDKKVSKTDVVETHEAKTMEKHQPFGEKNWANLFKKSNHSQQVLCNGFEESAQMPAVKTERVFSERLSAIPEHSKDCERVKDHVLQRDDNSEGWETVISRKNKRQSETPPKQKCKQSRETTQKFNKNLTGLSRRKEQPLDHPEPCNDQYYCAARIQFFRRKTSICKQWQADRCPYGKECIFAHGRAEIKPLPKYEMCERNLAGACNAKSNECVYAHSLLELRKPPSNPKVQKVAVAAPYLNAGDLRGRDQIRQHPLENETLIDLDWRICPNSETVAECSICAEDLHLRDRLRLDCGHDEFHYKCISEWINERAATCPLCRKATDVRM